MRTPLPTQRLRGQQRKHLEAWYHTTPSPRTRVRIQIVLLSSQGYTVAEIARITHQSVHTVRRWLHRFMEEGCAGLQEAPHSGRPPEVTQGVEAFLRECLQASPREYGVPRPTWTTGSLARVVRRHWRIGITDECVRQHLHHIDAVCRRPTWTVKHWAAQQSGYAQKKPPLQDCCGIHHGVRMSTCKMKPNSACFPL